MTEQVKDLQQLRNIENIERVKDMLAKVSSNDLPLALQTLTEDIDWQSPVTNTIKEPVSWAKPRHNRGEVKAFFEELYEKIRGFEMKFLSYAALDDRVIVEGTTHGVVEATGRDYTTSWVMVITLKDGKISKLRHYYDTADIVKAFQAARKTRKAA